MLLTGLVWREEEIHKEFGVFGVQLKFAFVCVGGGGQLIFNNFGVFGTVWNCLCKYVYVRISDRDLFSELDGGVYGDWKIFTFLAC